MHIYVYIMDHWYSTRNRSAFIEVSTIAESDPCHDDDEWGAGNRTRKKEHVEEKKKQNSETVQNKRQMHFPNQNC